ncbi:MAG: phosphoglycerate dehydrogenase [Magnetococcales bacterium]|nr:phosphoglycerate dehydrogenase [Magnetococcales bacterium]
MENAAQRRILITTVPFGEVDRTPLELLEAAGIEYLINPLNRKLREEELAEMAGAFGVLIAGTEPITDRVMENAPHLQLISRVGIGLDSVDLLAAKRREIAVSYTPDAPAPAVAELTIGLMVSLLRHFSLSDRRLREGHWHRFMGRRLNKITVGVIGVGRIGRKVIRLLKPFGAKVLANDLAPNEAFRDEYGFEWAEKERIYREADLITFHLPLTKVTKHLVRTEQMMLMKPDAILINTARGGIIHELDLAKALEEKRIGGGAIDAFEEEPYNGPLSGFENALLTSHMGSMSEDCRARMELEATQEAIRFLKGETCIGTVPQTEYDVQSQGL